MASAEVKERLAADVALWQADGLISAETCAVLKARYETPGFGVVTFIKYLGICGGVFAAFGLMGLVGAMAGSEVVGGLMAGGVGAGLIAGGLKLAADARGRYRFSSRAVLTLGVLGFTAAVALLVHALSNDSRAVLVISGALSLGLTFFLAYRHHNGFLLVLGVLGFFHWVGSWEEMVGRSTYDIDIEDPRAMALVALGVIGVGVYHQKFLAERTLRFNQVYEALGLSYLNLSLLILSIFPGRHASDGAALPWIVLLTLAAIAQIIAGARLHDGLFTGFGVTFLAIDLFTRFGERFWAPLGAGSCFLLGGALLLGSGIALELVLKRMRTEEAP